MKTENRKQKYQEATNVYEKEDNYPTVICDNLRLVVGLGQWLETLPSKRIQRGYGRLIHVDLSVQELLRMKHISNGKRDMIIREFSRVLSLAGIDSNETCLLSRYNEYDKTFDCYFVSSNLDARIILERRDYQDGISYLTIDTKREEQRYEFFPENEKEEMRLNLISRIIKPKKIQKDFKMKTKKKVRYR